MKDKTMLNLVKIIKLSIEINFLESQNRPSVSQMIHNLAFQYNYKNSLSEIRKCTTYEELIDYLGVPFMRKYELDFEKLKNDIITCSID